MGELTYLPNHKHLNGADHYVLGYAMDNQSIYLHDPAGFPYVPLTLEQFKKAWKADDIPYCKGHFKYWSSPKRPIRYMITKYTKRRLCTLRKLTKSLKTQI